MPMVKKNSTTAAPAAPAAPTATAVAPAATLPTQTVAPENGTTAAIGRLKKKTEDTAAAPAAGKSYQGRDFDKEARGKTRCVQFEAALMSPAIAGMKFDTMEQYLALCRQAAEYGLAYTFDELPKK